MNKEEIEELKEFTIDLTNVDEIALGLEICSKKSNMVIQEFIDTIFQLQQENQELKDNWNKIEQIIENERMSHWAPSPLFLTELLSKMQELENGDSNE